MSSSSRQPRMSAAEAYEKAIAAAREAEAEAKAAADKADTARSDAAKKIVQSNLHLQAMHGGRKSMNPMADEKYIALKASRSAAAAAKMEPLKTGKLQSVKPRAMSPASSRVGTPGRHTPGRYTPGRQQSPGRYTPGRHTPGRSNSPAPSYRSGPSSQRSARNPSMPFGAASASSNSGRTTLGESPFHPSKDNIERNTEPQPEPVATNWWGGLFGGSSSSEKPSEPPQPPAETDAERVRAEEKFVVGRGGHHHKDQRWLPLHIARGV